MGDSVPLKNDPVYAAIGCRWPRETIVHMLPKEKVGKKLVASGHLSVAGTWLAACACVEHAALAGLPPPPEAAVVERILREHSPDDL